MFTPIETCNHVKSRTLSISLIIHLVLLLWLLGFVHNNRLTLNNDSTISAQQHDDEDDTTWASTKARQGGAPVYFVSTPSVPQQQAASSTPHQNTQTLTTQSSVTSTSDIKQEHDASEQPAVTENHYEEPVSQPTEKTEVKQSPDQTTNIEQTNVFIQAARQALQQQNAYRREMYASPKPVQQPRTSSYQTDQSRIVTSTSSSQKQIPSMAQIAQGFSGFVKEEGEYTINVIGDPRKLPTEQQLKQHHYVEKLLQCLHTSYSTMKKQEPPLLYRIKDASLTFILHRDGSITDMRITQTSNNPALDSFIMALFTDAGRSFPPLPTYFKRDIYHMNWLVKFE